MTTNLVLKRFTPDILRIGIGKLTVMQRLHPMALIMSLVVFGAIALAQPIYRSGNQTGKTPDLRLLLANSSKDSRAEGDSQWLLIFPPITPVSEGRSTRFSGWIPDSLFESDQACNRHKALLINDQLAPISYRLLNSECIPAFEYMTGQDADVIIAGTQFILAVSGFSSHYVFGKVFNRGQGIARNVVARYYVQDANGVTLTRGEVPTTPPHIPALAFGEFRTPEIGSWNLNGLSVRAEATWSKK